MDSVLSSALKQSLQRATSVYDTDKAGIEHAIRY
jgi:hypothetical protein